MNQVLEILKSYNIVLKEKELNFYMNSIIITLTAIISIYLVKRNSKNYDNLDSYDWNKFIIVGENKNKGKKTEYKEKPKQRVKEFSKGNGYIKEEDKFPVLIESKKDFLTFEETTNFQDLINYAATINKEKDQIYPIESIYSQAIANKTDNSNIKANEKIDSSINEVILK